ncbi:cytochrome d ubiquinol oxidase subunit II [Streptomyces sp. NPDC056817]|uniref:cytochrome d ubiquinol oxidase subunit II n=1 Tax=Streptomyces sp. NPDC056817 TaxID=3345950 RepID=UPI0036832AA2
MTGRRRLPQDRPGPVPRRRPVGPEPTNEETFTVWEIIWYGLLGVLLAGYLALDGITLGTGIIGRLVARSDDDRRTVAAATGPFFLGNEVWLVSAAGVTLGGFPGLESTVITGFYPVIVLAVAALLVREAATQFRRRVASERWLRRWDGLVQGACLVLAVMWGALAGAVLGALPVRGGELHVSAGVLLRPVPVLSALTAVAVFALHGAVFLAMRTKGGVAGRAVRLAVRLGPVAAVLGVLTLAGAALDPRARDGVLNVLPAALFALAAIGAALFAPRLAASATGRGGLGAPAVSALAALLPVAAIGAAHWPQAVVSTHAGQNMAVKGAAADPSTLSVVGPVVLLVLPVLLAFQAMQWWAHRTPADDRSPAYL